MSPLASVLRSSGSIYLVATSLVGRLPAAMSALAIVQLVRLQGGDFSFAGVLTAVYVVAGALGQPLLGRWIDRSGQSVVLVVAAVTSAIGFTAMAAFTPDIPVFAVVGSAVAGAFAPPLEPSLRSLWPRIAPNEIALKAAFSFDAGAQEIIFILGPLVTIVGIAAFGATGNILFAAALGLVGSLAFAAHRLSRSTRPDPFARESHVSPMRNSRFVRVIVFLFGIGLPVGMLTIYVTAYGEAHRAPAFAGWALATNAFGALIGATLSALRPTRAPSNRLLSRFGILLGIGYLPLTATGAPLPVILVFAGIGGLMLPPTLGQVFDWIHRSSAASALTEANSWAISAISVGIAAGTGLAGVVVTASGSGALPIIAIYACAATIILSLFVRNLPPVTDSAETGMSASEGFRDDAVHHDE